MTARPNLRDRRWPEAPSPEEARCVLEILDHGPWVDGPWTEAAEEMLCEVTGARHAVMFNSCTSAIHASLAAMGCGRGIPVHVPALTFAGTVTGAIHLGAELVFTDVDPGTLTMTQFPVINGFTLPVDLHGVPHTFEREDQTVLTDACQALGSYLGHQPVGKTGHHAWSFSPAKLVTAPDGGAITTSNAYLAEILRQHRDYGLRGDGLARANGEVVWPHGHNWRPSEVTACIVAHRLGSLPAVDARARKAANRLREGLLAAGLWIQKAPERTSPTWHKIRFGPLDWHPAKAARLQVALENAGVPVHRWGQRPLHMHHAARERAASDVLSFPVAEAAAAGTLCLGTEQCPPMTWTDAEVDQVCEIVSKVAPLAATVSV